MTVRGDVTIPLLLEKTTDVKNRRACPLIALEIVVRQCSAVGAEGYALDGHNVSLYVQGTVLDSRPNACGVSDLCSLCDWRKSETAPLSLSPSSDHRKENI